MGDFWRDLNGERSVGGWSTVRAYPHADPTTTGTATLPRYLAVVSQSALTVEAVEYHRARHAMFATLCKVTIQIVSFTACSGFEAGWAEYES